MPIPNATSNFPAVDTHTSVDHQFNKFRDLSDWDWYGTGHVGPEALTDQDGGAITLGSGSASAADYIQGQMIGSSIRLNRLGKEFRFLYKVQLSSATLAYGVFGPCITNTSLIATNITDGIGFYTNGTNWNAFVAFDSITQYTTYTQQLAVAAVTTSEVTLGIKIVTDPTTLGAGSVSWWINGTQVGYTAQSSAAWLPHDELLRSSMALANGSGVAQTCIVSRHAFSDQS